MFRKHTSNVDQITMLEEMDFPKWLDLDVALHTRGRGNYVGNMPKHIEEEGKINDMFYTKDCSQS
jgi:hypothetical protein